MPKVKVSMVLELDLELARKKDLGQVLDALDYKIGLTEDVEDIADITAWWVSTPIPRNVDIFELMAAAEESLTAWEGEEESVKSEHAETIKRLRKAIKGKTT